MRVVVKKIDGVRDVKVSLEKGVATIAFAPVNRVKVEQIWEAVRSNGFTPRSAELRARGTLRQLGDTVALTVTGSDQVFVLTADSASRDALAALRRQPGDSRVVVTGLLNAPATRGKAESRTLSVRTFVLE